MKDGIRFPGDQMAEIEELAEMSDRRMKAMLYRKVFCNSEEGRMVFHDILSQLNGFADELQNDRDMILYNASRQFLKTMGIWEPAHSFDIARDLTRLPLLNIDEEKKE
jgi:hypothetical protein